MDTRRIRKLIELVKETGIGELEVQSGDESVRISTQAPTPTYAPPTPVVHVAAPTQAAPSSPPLTTATDIPTQTPPTNSGYTQKSPMVGTVYLAASPGAKPLVAVGDHINAGETICLIEAMKMFNKIEAEKSGTISARLIENEQPVEFDQELFIIEPDE